MLVFSTYLSRINGLGKFGSEAKSEINGLGLDTQELLLH